MAQLWLIVRSLTGPSIDINAVLHIVRNCSEVRQKKMCCLLPRSVLSTITTGECVAVFKVFLMHKVSE